MVGGLAPSPQTPVCDTFELHKLSQHVTKVRYLHFSTINLSIDGRKSVKPLITKLTFSLTR